MHWNQGRSLASRDLGVGKIPTKKYQRENRSQNSNLKTKFFKYWGHIFKKIYGTGFCLYFLSLTDRSVSDSWVSKVTPREPDALGLRAKLSVPGFRRRDDTD
jgi:hypothetical protein